MSCKGLKRAIRMKEQVIHTSKQRWLKGDGVSVGVQWFSHSILWLGKAALKGRVTFAAAASNLDVSSCADAKEADGGAARK